MLILGIINKLTVTGLNVTKKPFLASSSILKYQSAGMMLKSLRDPDFKRPPAFPYKDKKYTLLDAIFDRGVWRFEENSKVIIVDGPPASGKTKVAKEIAEAYDMFYMPPFNLDNVYINDMGYDHRLLNDQLPLRVRSFDIHEFLENPKDERNVTMHLQIYKNRLLDYVDGLAHVLNTGQGVVMDTSVYCDHVFAKTFTSVGFYPKNFYKFMQQTYLTTADDLLRPHAIIYLDQSVETTQKKIKERNLPGENNSPVYKSEVLELLESNHKKYLKDISKHAEILVYDWNTERDSEMIIEDIENLNLDEYLPYDPKMLDWRTENTEHVWLERRIRFSDKDYFEKWAAAPSFVCPEVYIGGEDLKTQSEVYDKAPGNEYAKGYNIAQGEPFPYFK